MARHGCTHIRPRSCAGTSRALPCNCIMQMRAAAKLLGERIQAPDICYRRDVRKEAVRPASRSQANRTRSASLAPADRRCPSFLGNLQRTHFVRIYLWARYLRGNALKWWSKDLGSISYTSTKDIMVTRSATIREALAPHKLYLQIMRTRGQGSVSSRSPSDVRTRDFTDAYDR